MRCLLVFAAALTATAALKAQPPDLLAPTDALSPADERKAFTVPAGFDVQLVAAEPDIGKPMQMAFDAKGRLWVATSRLYPFPAEAGKGTDKLYVLSDFGDDGKAKSVKLFADNLNIPIGVMPLPSCDGCIVSNIHTTCEIVKLTDTDGDGKADKSEVLFSGFGTRDTHGMVNSFTLMPDGWVYACHGYLNQSKVKGKDGHEIEIQSGNVLRFKLDGSRIEVFTRGQVNPFGLAVDPWFNLYTADCHSRPMTALIPGAVYESFGKPHDGLGYGPNMIGYEPGGTGMCGLAWYDAAHFPKEHLGMMYLGNVITNRVNAAKIAWTGATPNAVQQPDLIASSDRWFRPVDIKLGPDGAVYVSDFYNKVIGHYEMPLKHPGRDKDRGRIWRVVYKGQGEPGALATGGGPKMPFTDLTTQDVREVYDLLDSPNLTVRLLATQQLVRRRADVDKAMEAGVKPAKPFGDRGLVHGGWRMFERSPDPLPGTTATLTTLKQHHSPFSIAHELRQAALVPTWDDKLRAAVIECLKDVPVVQRAAAETLIAHPHADNVKPLVELIQQMPAGDTHTTHAARIALRNSLRGNEQARTEAWKTAMADEKAGGVVADVMLGVPTPAGAKFLAELFNLRGTSLPAPAAVAEHIGRYGTSDDDVALDRIFELYLQDPKGGDLEKGAEVLRRYLGGIQASGKGRAPAGLRLFRGAKLTDRGRTPAGMKLLAEALGMMYPLAGSSPEILAALADIARAPANGDDARAAALDNLCRLAPSKARPHVLEILNGKTESAALKERALIALAGVPGSDVSAALKAVPYRVAVAAAVNMASTPAGGGELFAGVKAGFVPARVLQDKVVLERLKASKVADWEKQVGDLTRGLPAADAKLAELIKQRGAKFAAAKGDKAEGAKLFTKHCAACHAIAGTGGKIAPQLDGVGVRGLERVLEDVLDPNRNVDVAFRARVLNLFDGTTKTGLMIKTDGEVLVMADAEGKEFRVPLKDIETNRETALSPMPANVADIMTEAEFAHLVAYLLDQKAVDPPRR